MRSGNSVIATPMPCAPLPALPASPWIVPLLARLPPPARPTPVPAWPMIVPRSEEHTSELQSLMRNSYAVFCLKKKNETYKYYNTVNQHRQVSDTQSDHK